ncbi:MAG TPA: response regulator [Thermoflexia bacterium]|nr:response regulator [Thermoflexia bacterium]
MDQVTVLIIEDDADIRVILSDLILKPAGYQVLLADDGERGLQRALTDDPDIILLDLNLPYLSGLDLLRLLRQQHHNVPVIVISAHGSERTILEAFRLGAKDFMQKPFRIDEVQAATENALTEERLRRDKEKLTRVLSRTSHRLQRQLQNWMALNDIAQALTSTLDETEVFQRVMANVNRILRVEAGSLLLLDQETGELEFKITLKGTISRFSSLRLQPGQGIAGWVALHGEPLLIPDVAQDSRFCDQVDQAVDFKSHAILCVPLKNQEQVIGVLEVINRQNGPQSPAFTPGDLELLTMLASWVTVAVENARLNRAAQEWATMTALRQTTTTMAHYINNLLMTFLLELDDLEMKGVRDPTDIPALLALARQCIWDIASVVRALEQLEEVRIVTYVGTEKMLDINAALEQQLRQKP